MAHNLPETRGKATAAWRNCDIVVQLYDQSSCSGNN
jgi:hypothetical protein